LQKAASFLRAAYYQGCDYDTQYSADYSPGPGAGRHASGAAGAFAYITDCSADGGT
jgi:hypothetical protein